MDALILLGVRSCPAVQCQFLPSIFERPESTRQVPWRFMYGNLQAISSRIIYLGLYLGVISQSNDFNVWVRAPLLGNLLRPFHFYYT